MLFSSNTCAKFGEMVTTAVSNICRYMVDAADHEKLDAAKNELHSLLDKPQLTGIPVSENKQDHLL